MSKYDDIRAALAAQIQLFEPNINIYYYVPRTFIPPAVILRPDIHRTVNYMVAQSSYLAEWFFSAVFVVGLVDETAAQQQAGEMISPGSSVIRALNATKPPQTGWAQVTDGAISEISIEDGYGGTGLYTCAELKVKVTA